MGFDKRTESRFQLCEPNNAEFVSYVCHLAARTRRGGLWWCAPLCSPWIWFCRRVTGRSKERPEGNTEDPRNVYHNGCMGLLAEILLMLHAIGVLFAMEQPCTTVLFEFGPMKNAMHITQAIKISFSMGRWGAPTLKPTWVMGTWPGLQALHVLGGQRPLPRIENKTYKYEGKWVTKNGTAMKDSQEYPSEFCKAIAQIYEEHKYFRAFAPGDDRESRSNRGGEVFGDEQSSSEGEDDDFDNGDGDFETGSAAEKAMAACRSPFPVEKKPADGTGKREAGEDGTSGLLMTPTPFGSHQFKRRCANWCRPATSTGDGSDCEVVSSKFIERPMSAIQ